MCKYSNSCTLWDQQHSKVQWWSKFPVFLPHFPLCLETSQLFLSVMLMLKTLTQPSFFLMFQPLLFWLVSDYVHNVHPHTDIPDGPRKLAISTLSLANGTSPARSPVNGVAGGQPLSQRKRLLKAPTLAELDSSDSDVSVFYIFSIARNLPKCWTRLLGQSHRSQSELDC